MLIFSALRFLADSLCLFARVFVLAFSLLFCLALHLLQCHDVFFSNSDDAFSVLHFLQVFVLLQYFLM